MPFNILILKDRPASTGSLFHSLKQSFPDDRIKGISAADLHNGVLDRSHANMFVLPGITGNISPYPDIIGDIGFKIMGDFAWDGGIVVTICGGAYSASQKTCWMNGQKIRLSLNPLFNGAAIGPVAGYGREPGSNQFDDVILIPVRHKMMDGQWREFQIPYCNGPALHPYVPDDPDTEILTVYSKVPHEPAALIRQSIGKGAHYASGVLPEISYQFIKPHATSGHVAKFMQELLPHEQGRQAMWNDFTSRLKRDMSRSLTTPSAHPVSSSGELLNRLLGAPA